MIASAELKPEMAVRIEGQIYKVLESEFKAGAGQAGGVVRAKLRNVSSGRMWEPHFRPDERLEELDVERQMLEFLYSDDDNAYFMHPETFEQIAVPRAILGPGERYLKPEMKIPIEFFESQPISMVFPAVVEIRVADTAPPVHSQQDSTWKEATLENGVQILVPLFIAAGELVRVDVESGRYLERVRAERKRGA